MLDHQLSQYKHGSKHCMMLAPVVTESKAKRSPALQHAVDSFVPRPGKAHGPPVVAVLGIVGSATAVLTLVAFVAENLFAWKQPSLRDPTEDGYVLVVLGCKRPNITHNLASSNADRKLIAKSSSLELARKPHSTEWNWVANAEVGAINSDQAPVALVTSKSFLPSDLVGGEEVEAGGELTGRQNIAQNLPLWV